MATIMTRGSIAAGVLFGLALTAPSSAQLTTDPGTRTNYLNCGGFTLTGGDTVLLHASLDDEPAGRQAWVTLQLYDDLGVIRAQKKAVVLQAGQSTTLPMTVSTPGSGVFRAHVEFKEADLPVSARRAGTALVEVLDLTSQPRTSCIPLGNGGLRPDP